MQTKSFFAHGDHWNASNASLNIEPLRKRVTSLPGFRSGVLDNRLPDCSGETAGPDTEAIINGVRNEFRQQLIGRFPVLDDGAPDALEGKRVTVAAKHLMEI